MHRWRYKRRIAELVESGWQGAPRLLVDAVDVAENGARLVSNVTNRIRDFRQPLRLSPFTSTVCVGGVAWGGDGKTPLARHLARRLATQGLNVAMVTRGFGGRSRSPTLIGHTSRMLDRKGEVRRYGDEAVMLSATLENVDVWSGPLRSTILAASRTEPDVLLVDDGLGLRGIRWDLCIALLSADRVVHRQLPAGPLRRPLCTTAEADVVGIRAPLQTPAEELQERMEVLLSSAGARNHPWFGFQLSPVQKGDGLPVHLASGIANVGRFERSAREAGYRITGCTWYPDHHVPTPRDLVELERPAGTVGAEAILVTGKDAPRFPRRVGEKEVLVLTSRIRVFKNPHVLDDALWNLARNRVKRGRR